MKNGRFISCLWLSSADSTMKICAAFLAILAVASASPAFDLEPLSDAMIFYINNVVETTWKAGRNFRPNEIDRVKMMLGVNMKKNKEYNELFLKKKEIAVNGDLPTNFDPRQKWTNCHSLNAIRDQSTCGSCWAFGAVEAMTDRICIKGGNATLSAEDVLTCCSNCGYGCGGGFPASAYDYYQNSGVVSGGLYHTKGVCQPYSLAPCDHHTKGRYKPCGPVVPTPKCKKQCQPGYPKSYKQDKHFGKEGYGVKDVTQIMTELVNNGPVTAAFTVYADFPSYKSGVYQHRTGEELGGHAIKIIGYGVEGGVDYWLVANSWNTDWGDKGYFKIRRGTNECGIEDSVVAGEPKL